MTMQSPNREYHFKPTAEDERHIADVDVSHHAKALLRIKEGYADADGEDNQDNDDDADLPERFLKSSTVHSASYEITGGEKIDLQDLVNMAFDDSGLDEDDWNALPDTERYEYIDTTLAELRGEDRGNEAEMIEKVGASVNATEQQAEIDKGAPVVELNDKEDDESKGAAEQTAIAAEDAKKAIADANSDGVNDSLEGLTIAQLTPLYVERFGRKPSSKLKIEEIKRALSEDDE